jgi:tetratricopeptide (TPR) repeat protein
MSGIKIIRRDTSRDARIIAEIADVTQTGQIARASEMARAALDNGLINPMLLNLRAWWHEQNGHSAQALADLELALSLDSRDLKVRNPLGILLGRLGRWNEAVALMEETAKMAPDQAETLFNLGWAREFTGELQQARRRFEQAAALDPLFAAPLAHLASLAYRRADWAAAEELAGKALAIEPQQPVALTALAMTALAQRDLTATEARLAQLGDLSKLDSTEAALAQTALGDLRDAQGRHAEAFAAYAARNARKFREAEDRFNRPGTTATDYVNWLAAYFAQSEWSALPAEIPPDRSDGAIGHVFLVGFPRSGTTLLENVLASHPRVAALDERDTLGEAAMTFLSGEEGRAKLARISPAEIQAHRAIYWQRVRRFGAEVEGKVFVDKYPLSSIKLALVAKLFPGAKILFALRDPRDVLFSCFRRSFSLNPSMFELLDLERGARLYSAVMTLSMLYREKLGLPWHTLRYETLVRDFEGEMRRVCDFIGLEWDARMRDFAALSRDRTIKTPSSTQVVRGLYREGAGQWQAYASQLAPAIAILEPWVRRFGYETDPTSSLP